jgi:transmembrane sensor
LNASERINQLYTRYVSSTATEAELAELFTLASEPANEPVFIELFSGSWDELYRISEDLSRLKAVPIVHRVHFLKTAWFRYAAAAIVLLVSGAAIWWEISRFAGNDGTRSESVVQTADIAPGGDKAVLTLADGTKIILDNAANGNVAQQGNTKIIKLDNGQLAYQTPLSGRRGVGGEALYNTIATPKGGQYQIVLPDGSKVWLNAASSIKFPAAFTGSTRQVEIAGEVYMEIAKNAKQPFIVKTNGTEVQVLGTSFNINAYSDEEAIKTTLIEGSVKVVKENSEAILKPGEQAVISNSAASKIQKILVETDEVLAWKNGDFDFGHSDIRSIMRQLSRWYDIDVVYEGQMPERSFSGSMQRNMNLSAALRVLERSNIHFRMEGKKLIVMP